MNLDNLNCIERLALTLAVSNALQNSQPIHFTEEMCLQCVGRYREMMNASQSDTGTLSASQLLLNGINKTYADNLAMLKTALGYAHTGLIQSAIDGSLDSDANCWHLHEMADIGLATEQNTGE